MTKRKTSKCQKKQIKNIQNNEENTEEAVNTNTKSIYIDQVNKKIQLTIEIESAHQMSEPLQIMGVNSGSPLNVIISCTFFNDQVFATANYLSKTIHVWDSQSGEKINILSSQFESSWVDSMMFIRQLSLLVSFSKDNYLTFYKYNRVLNNKIKLIKRVPLEEQIMFSMKYSSHFNTLICLSRQGNIIIINMNNFKIIYQKQQKTFKFTSFDLLLKNLVVAGDDKGQISIWKLPLFKHIKTLQKPQENRNNAENLNYHKKVVHETKVVKIQGISYVVTASYDRKCNIFKVSTFNKCQVKNQEKQQQLDVNVEFVQQLDCSVDRVEFLKRYECFIINPFPTRGTFGGSELKILKKSQKNEYFVLSNDMFLESNTFINSMGSFSDKFLLGFRDNIVQLWSLKNMFDEENKEKREMQILCDSESNIHKRKNRNGKQYLDDSVKKQVKK